MKSSVNEITDLCERCDVLFLQETWLCEQELAMLSIIHKDFYSKGISSMNDADGMRKGRPHGGLAVLWRKTLGTACTVKSVDDTRLLMCTISEENKQITLLNTYLPCDDGGNVDDYRMYLAKISSYLDTTYSAAFGDFNGNISSTSHRFGNELISFCNSESLVLSDKVICDEDTFTFYSEAHDTVAWLDHLVSTHNFHSIIERIWTDNSMVTSDHFPVFAEISLSSINIVQSESSRSRSNHRRIDWSSLSKEQLSKYRQLSRVALSKIHLNHSLILCDDTHCVDPAHTSAIEQLYREIVSALLESGHESIVIKRDYKQVAGWHEVCADHHGQAREAFKLWNINGRPRFGPIYHLMKVKRAQFKAIMRQCKIDSEQLYRDTLAKKLLHNDSKHFWKEIQRINSQHKSTSIADTVGGVSGLKNICNMWKEHFQGLLNSVSRSDFDHTELDNMYFERFTPCHMANVISDLETGKSPGPDSITAEHIKYSDPTVNVLLSIFVNCCIIHGFLPDGLMETFIVPIVKNTKGVISSKDNYRPIAITSVFSKLFEKLILERYGEMLYTTDNQFGYKSHSSSDLCIFTLKQIVDYYKSNGSPTYLCFLDASKAFDRVHHNILFSKLLKRNIPHVIIRLLMFWYITQTFVVKWGGTLSDSFKVTNGVRQGGILSPVLFSVYIDELSGRLSNSKIGCVLNSVYFNHIVYADDTVLLAPSPTALQRLVDICSEYAVAHDLLYNETKTKYMCIKPPTLKDLFIPNVSLNGTYIKKVDSEKYLGYIIRNDCSDNDHIINEMRKTYVRGHMLIRKFKICSEDVKVKLFKTYCSSIYCCALISKYTQSVLKKLHVAFNKIFKSFMNAPKDFSASALFVSVCVDNFPVLRRKLTFSFFDRVCKSSNSLVFGVYSSAYFRSCKLKKEWDKVLF